MAPKYVFRTATLSVLALYIAGCDGFIGTTRDQARDGLPPCDPPLTLSPQVAVVAPLDLVTLSASGGRGEYAFEITDNVSGAHINPDDGAYLAGATTGVRDRLRVTAAECEGEAFAVVEVPHLLVVQPGSASVPPGTSFAIRASMGSGSFTYEVASTVSGAVITPAGVYTAGPRTGVDVVRVTDSVTGTARDATIQVSFDAVLRASPEHLALPVGSRTTLHVHGGSGQVSADADGMVARFQDGTLEALAPGSQTLTVTDVFTQQTTRVTLDVAPPLEAPFARGGDKDVFTAIFMPAIEGRDLDGDGYSDVVVGYADTSYAHALSGAVYVYRGAPAFEGRWQPALTLSGAESRERFGTSIALGDFDGDGGPELAVGAPNADAAFADAGLVRVFAPSGSGEIFAAEARQIILGRAPLDLAGQALAACDFDGDGITDLAVGAPQSESVAGQALVANQGAIRIFRGSPDGLDTTNERIIYGMLPNAQGTLTAIANLRLGSVLAAADLDGDGRCELVSAAAGYVPSGATTAYGAVLVYRFDTDGAPDARPAMIIRSVAGAAATELGRGIALRDLDGDGRAEILTGERSTPNGRALVFRAALAGADITTANADATYDGSASGQLCGGSVDAVDADGDGAPELFVGCIGFDLPSRSDAGVVRVHAGVPGGLPASSVTRTLESGVALDRFGNVVAAAGDVDGDGRGDLVVHVRDGDSEGVNFGALRLRAADGGPLDVDMAMPGRSALQQHGASVALLGDLDGDGVDEVAVGAPLANVAVGVATNDGINAGRVMVYRGGQTTPWLLLEKHVLHGANDQFGNRVARLGDFDGDGRADLGVLALREGRPGTFPASFQVDATCPGSTGAAYVYGGVAGGLDPLPRFVVFSPTGELASVAGDFDFNGDGKRDLAIGGISWPSLDTTPVATVGGFRIYLGQAPVAGKTKVLCTPVLDVRGVATGDRMGGELLALGDIDGDGCDELAVSADRWESSSLSPNEGGVLVVFGTGASCTAGPRFAMLRSQIPAGGAGRALAAADLDGKAVGGRMVNELVVTSNIVNQVGVQLGAVWVIPGARLAAMPKSTTAPYPVTAFADTDEADVLVGAAGGEQFGTSVAALPALAGKPGVVLVGTPLSSDNGVASSGGVFGFAYVVTASGAGLSDHLLVRLGGEALANGRFGDAVAAHRTATRTRIVVGAPASKALAAGGASVDDGAAFFFAMDAID